MYDLFTREDRDELRRALNHTPPKPVFDAIDLLKYAEKVKRVLFKPIVDLKYLPGLNKSHENLDSLKQELNSFITRINSNAIILENNEKRGDLITCLVEDITQIEKMQAFLGKLSSTPKNTSTITEQPPMTQLEINKLPHEIWAAIFSSLSYQDTINMSNTCRALKQGPLAGAPISAFALSQRGFYSEHAFRMSDVQDACHQASEEGKVLFFFNSEDKFRATFRQCLNNCALATMMRTSPKK